MNTWPNGRFFLLGGVLLVGLALLVSGCAEGEGRADLPEKPNIIFIMADDLGYGDIEPYGQDKIKTPNLARMAEEGLLFTRYYAGSAVCAPSRSVLMTGLHTGHTPIRGNKSVEPFGNAPLPDSTLTVAEVLKAAGYATGAFGKWGLGAPGSTGLPTKQGFDEFFGYLSQARAHFYYPEFLFHGGNGDTARRVPLEGNKVAYDAFSAPGAGPPLQRGTYSHDRIMKEAMDFITGHQDEPFFLYLVPTIPHRSLTVPKKAMDPYLDENGESIFPEEPFPPGHHYTAQPMPHAAYAAMVTHLDRGVGRLLDTLHALGLEENTIVFFTSDNGPSGGSDPQFFNSNGPLRGHKRDLYEGGIRMPMIVWAPGRVPSGATSDQIWTAWDVLPTLADLAGTTVPDTTSMDGISVAPTILGREQEQQHEYLYWEFYEGKTAQAVRKGKWKAVRIPMHTGEIELYNLEEDPDESNDVAGEHPEVVAEMERIMAEAHIPSPIWTAPSTPSSR